MHQQGLHKPLFKHMMTAPSQEMHMLHYHHARRHLMHIVAALMTCRSGYPWESCRVFFGSSQKTRETGAAYPPSIQLSHLTAMFDVRP